MAKQKVCKWVIRPGTQDGTFFAFTPCKRGYNFLSKVHSLDAIKPNYEGRICPICGGTIKCNTELCEDREIWI